MTYEQELLGRQHRKIMELQEELARERSVTMRYRLIAVTALAAFVMSLILSVPAEASVTVMPVAEEGKWSATVIRCTQNTDRCVKRVTAHPTEDACDNAVDEAVRKIGETRDVIVAFCLSSEEAHEQAQWEVQE